MTGHKTVLTRFYQYLFNIVKNHEKLKTNPKALGTKMVHASLQKGWLPLTSYFLGLGITVGAGVGSIPSFLGISFLFYSG